MMTNRLAVLACLTLAMTASSASAQRAPRPVELGIDGGLTFGLDDPNITLVNLPVQAFRVGFFISDRVSIEPRFNFTSFSGGGTSAQSYVVELGALFHPGGYRGRGLYIRPFGGIIGFNSETGDDSDPYLGAGVGFRFPFADRRLATRVEGNLSHLFDPGSTALGLLFGLSFFTR